jgi:hypothetical protein
LDLLFLQQDVQAICQYEIDRLPLQQVMYLFGEHAQVWIEGQLCENAFHAFRRIQIQIDDAGTVLRHCQSWLRSMDAV